MISARIGQPATVRATVTLTFPPSISMPRTMFSSTIERWISGSSTGRRASSTWASLGMSGLPGISTTDIGTIPIVANEDLTADEFGAAVAAVTSAFGDPTRRDIYLFVRSSPDGAKAAEVAEHFELHPNVARHHLEKLARGQLPRRRARAPRVRRAGRRSATAPPRATPTSRSRPSATTCSPRCSPGRWSDCPSTRPALLAEEVGYDYGRSIAARMEPTEGHRSVKAAVASVADALTAHGFAAHAEARGNLLTLVSEHCPFGEAAQKWPHVLCAVDTGMVRGMLEGLYGETQPQLTESRPDGDQHCVTRV